MSLKQSIAAALCGGCLLFGPNVSADALTGVYLGGSLGMFTTVVSEVENKNTGFTFMEGKEQTAITDGKLHVGYARRFGDLYVAIELAATVHGETEVDVSEGDTTLWTTTYEGQETLGLRLGHYIGEQTVAYLKLTESRAKYSVDYTREESQQGNVSLPAIESSESERIRGSGIGLGMEHRITPNLGFWIEAVRTQYDAEDFLEGVFFSPAEGYSYETTVTNVGAGVSYYF